jgi:hypothetical protein
MIHSIQKIKGFAVGIGVAGLATIAAGAPQAGISSCSGSCAQCGACGLTALPLVIWLAARRWQPIAKIRGAAGILWLTGSGWLRNRNSPNS